MTMADHTIVALSYTKLLYAAWQNLLPQDLMAFEIENRTPMGAFRYHGKPMGSSSGDYGKPTTVNH
jgi:hypothetical protein